MKRIVVAFAALALIGLGTRTSNAQFLGGMPGGFAPYGFGNYNPYVNGMFNPYGGYGYGGYGGYGFGYGGYGYYQPQTVNQLGFLADTVRNVTRSPRRYDATGFRSRGVRRGRRR